MVYLTRKAEFSASHYYHNPDFTPEEKPRNFIVCVCTKLPISLWIFTGKHESVPHTALHVFGIAPAASRRNVAAGKHCHVWQVQQSIRSRTQLCARNHGQRLGR